MILVGGELFVGDFARRVSADVLEHLGKSESLALVLTGHHRTARYENGGEVESASREEHTRDDFVTVGDENDRVERVSGEHYLDRIGDKLARAKAVLHTLVVHCEAVAHAYRIELKGNAARVADSVHYLFGNIV